MFCCLAKGEETDTKIIVVVCNFSQACTKVQMTCTKIKRPRKNRIRYINYYQPSSSADTDHCFYDLGIFVLPSEANWHCKCSLDESGTAEFQCISKYQLLGCQCFRLLVKETLGTYLNSCYFVLPSKCVSSFFFTLIRYSVIKRPHHLQGISSSKCFTWIVTNTETSKNFNLMS